MEQRAPGITADKGGKPQALGGGKDGRKKSTSRDASAHDTPIDAPRFRKLLMTWYREHARSLPWRGAADPYHIWVSEVMLQQTRVAAVLEHYAAFLRRFPTVLALALADESAVLSAWSGLGYYRRARMLHRAAQFITRELHGVLPTTAIALRTLPGVGEYTCAAIASIAFGESVAVVDGNVERVLLRITGRTEEPTAAARAATQRQATALLPPHRRRTRTEGGSPAGDHNQAMMELGATICLPRAPLCLNCPVYPLCATRGEHPTPPRAPTRSRPAAYLLELRKSGTSTEVLLEERSPDATLMPGMLELPPLPEDAVHGREPVLRLRHAITDTNYYVRIFSPQGRTDAALHAAIPAADRTLRWVKTSSLHEEPLTGLARKVLQRTDVMSVKLT